MFRKIKYLFSKLVARLRYGSDAESVVMVDFPYIETCVVVSSRRDRKIYVAVGPRPKNAEMVIKEGLNYEQDAAKYLAEFVEKAILLHWSK